MSSTGPKFGKNLFHSKIADTGAELAMSGDPGVGDLPIPGDYDYNPFYLGNLDHQPSSGKDRPPSPIDNDDLNPFYTAPDNANAEKPTSRRQLINDMLQEMQRLSTNPVSNGSNSSKSGFSGAEAEYTTASVSFCCGGDDVQDNNRADIDYTTFSVKVGDDGGTSEHVSGIACGSDEPMDPCSTSRISSAVSTSATSSTGDSGIGSQTSEAAIKVETRLLRFLRDPKLTEFRFEGRLAPPERRAVRWFAKERGLFFKEVALRGHERAYVVKKPFAMARDQQAKQREAERKAKKEEASRLLAEYAEKDSKTSESSPANDGMSSFSVKAGGRTMAATVACSEACVETDPLPLAGGAAAAKERKDNWCQTISEQNFLCYVCQDEVPLVIKPVHIGACLAQLRQQLRQEQADADLMCEQLVRRQAELRRHKRPGDKRKAAMRQAIEDDKARLAERFNDMQRKRNLLEGGKQKTDDATEQKRLEKLRPFESVHANDFQRLLVEAKLLDKLCSVRECGHQVADGVGVPGGCICGACGRRFCPDHLDGPLHGCRRGGGGGSAAPTLVPTTSPQAAATVGSSAPTKFERDRLRQGLRDRLAIMAERRK